MEKNYQQKKELKELLGICEEVFTQFEEYEFAKNALDKSIELNKCNNRKIDVNLLNSIGSIHTQALKSILKHCTK